MRTLTEIKSAIMEEARNIFQETRDGVAKDLIAINYRIKDMNLTYHLFIIKDDNRTHFFCLGDTDFYIKLKSHPGSMSPEFFIDQSEYSKILECIRVLEDISANLLNTIKMSSSNFITIEKNLIAGDYLFATPDKKDECLNSAGFYIDMIKSKFASPEILKILEGCGFRIKKI